MCPDQSDTPPWGDLLGDEPRVSRETILRLRKYHTLLKNWQSKTNLVSRHTLDQFWTRHVADSLQCLAILPKTTCWIDLGSGAGFPGMVIAIADRDDKEKQHHLIESNNKKCAFLRMAARETGANAVIHTERIESVTKQTSEVLPLPRTITARALASLPQLMEWSEPLLCDEAVALFHKGRDYRREVEECNGLWQFDLVVHESRVVADSVLLEIRNPKRRNV